MAGDNGRQEVLPSAARTERVSGRVSALTGGWQRATMVVDVGAHALGRAVLAACLTCKPRRNRVGVVTSVPAP